MWAASVALSWNNVVVFFSLPLPCPISVAPHAAAVCCRCAVPRCLDRSRSPFMADILSMVLNAIYKLLSLSQWHRNLRRQQRGWGSEEGQGGTGGGNDESSTSCWICVSVLNGACCVIGWSCRYECTCWLCTECVCLQDSGLLLQAHL